VTLIIPFIAGKIGKRNLVWTGCIFGFIGSVGVHFFKESILMVIVMSSLASIGVAFINGIIYVMCAESVDYGEWKHKVRVQGFLMAFIGFAVKVSNSFVSMISTAIMNAGGYVGGSETQTASAVNAIEFCYVGIPGILFVVIFIVNIFYKLDKMYPQIQTELELRRAAIDQ
jgi:putative xylose-proton symporter